MRRPKTLGLDDEESLVRVAKAALTRELGLDAEHLLQDFVEVTDVAAGTCLMKQDSHKV